MKRLLLWAVTILQVITVDAQAVMTGKMTFAIPGGAEGKNYAAIIHTDMSKKELVRATTDYLSKYKLVDKNKVKLNDISEETAEYAIPFLLRQTLASCKGLLGIKYTACPTKMYGQLRFEFYDNGNVMVVIEDFSNTLLITTTPPNETKLSQAMSEYRGEGVAVGNSNSIFGKILIWANTSPEERKDFYRKLDDYFADIDSKYKVYDQLVANKEAEWMTGKEYADFREAQGGPGSKGTAEGIRKFLADGRLPGIPQDRWENDIRVCYDNLFKAVAGNLNGSIVGVAEDGEQTWAVEDGRLLPTDAKQKKDFKKKGLDYFTQGK